MGWFNSQNQSLLKFEDHVKIIYDFTHLLLRWSMMLEISYYKQRIEAFENF